jgi:hypothetical protein
MTEKAYSELMKNFFKAPTQLEKIKYYRQYLKLPWELDAHRHGRFRWIEKSRIEIN